MLRTLVLVAAVTLVPAALGAQLAGCWTGTVEQGAEQRRMVISIAGGASGVSTIHALVQDVGTDTITDPEGQGTSWRFRVPTAGGEPVFEGTLSADGARFSGTAIRGDTATPFTFRRVVPGSRTLTPGYWTGALEVDGVPRMRINLDVIEAPCDQVLVMMDSPDQGANDLPVTDLTMVADTLRLELSYVGGSYRGILSSDGRALTGAWTQSGPPRTLNFALSEERPEIRRPQQPRPPFPYGIEEVTYWNEAGGVRLAGTLTVPAGAGPHPTVILISGSGAQDRDESIMGHKPFLVLADYLTRNGVAVLRYDDRGVGGSGGNTFTATLEDNSTDVMAALAFLKTRAEIDHKRIGLVGHSEGGWVAPLVATKSGDVAFIVMLGGPGVDAEQLLYAQQEALFRASGADERLIAANNRVSGLAFHAVARTSDAAEARQIITQGLDSLKATLPDHEWTDVEELMALIPEETWETQLRAMVTPWFRYLLSYDPKPALQQLTVPVLAIIGELDLQVPPAQNISALGRAFARGATDDYTVRELPGLNHLFQTAKTGLIAEYAQIEETMSRAVLVLVTEWILERTKR